jgi:hypothetical protein
MATLTIDTKRYGRLLASTTPRVIETKKEYAGALQKIEELMDQGAHRTPEEGALLALLVSLVQSYEEKHYPIYNHSPVEMSLPNGETGIETGRSGAGLRKLRLCIGRCKRQTGHQ